MSSSTSSVGGGQRLRTSASLKVTSSRGSSGGGHRRANEVDLVQQQMQLMTKNSSPMSGGHRHMDSIDQLQYVASVGSSSSSSCGVSRSSSSSRRKTRTYTRSTSLLLPTSPASSSAASASASRDARDAKDARDAALATGQHQLQPPSRGGSGHKAHGSSSKSQPPPPLGRSNSGHSVSSGSTPTSPAYLVEETSPRNRPGSAKEQRFDLQQLEMAIQETTVVMKSSEQADADASPAPVEKDVKRLKYKSLWGKARKQSDDGQAPPNGHDNADTASTEKSVSPLPSSSMTSSSSSRPSSKKWDQVLNPLLQQQRRSKHHSPSSTKDKDKRLARTSSQMNYYAQQQQQQQQHHVAPHQLQINSMNAPNQSTTQCDCGYDTCPFCNVLINMEMTDPNMLM